MVNWTKEELNYTLNYNGLLLPGKKHYPSSANFPKGVLNENFSVEDSPAMSQEFLKFRQLGQEEI